MNPHKFVKFIYEHKTMSLSDLSDKAGISHTSIRNWKKGISPRLIDIEAVLEVLGFELVIAKKHRPDFMPEREDALVQEVKNILNSPVTNNSEIARNIVVKIGAAYEGQTCLDLTDECVNLLRTISEYRNEINKLNGKIVELEYLQPFRNGATQVLRSMSIGQVLDFPAGDQAAKFRKNLWNTANMAGLKIKTRTVVKNGMVCVEATRIS